MNTAQIASLVRTILMIGGGIAVGRGWVSQEHLDALTDPALLLQIVGGLIAVGTAFYAVVQRSSQNLIKAAANLPEVERIVAPGIADAIPSAKVSAS